MKNVNGYEVLDVAAAVALQYLADDVVESESLSEFVVDFNVVNEAHDMLHVLDDGLGLLGFFAIPRIIEGRSLSSIDDWSI